MIRNGETSKQAQRKSLRIALEQAVDCRYSHCGIFHWLRTNFQSRTQGTNVEDSRLHVLLLKYKADPESKSIVCIYLHSSSIGILISKISCRSALCQCESDLLRLVLRYDIFLGYMSYVPIQWIIKAKCHFMHSTLNQ